MTAERLPAVADHVEAQLAEEGAPRGSVGELKECTRILDHAGFVERPSWAELRGGRRPFASVWTTSLESGTMAGNMLLPLPNTTFGRAWFYASGVPQTRLICDPTPAQVRATCCQVRLLDRVQSVPGTLLHPRPGAPPVAVGSLGITV